VNRVEQPENATTANSVDISDFFLKIKIGEKAALFDLYDRTSGLLFGLTLKILGNPAEAEETLLNIYTRIWKDPLSCSPDFPPLAQLVMIARSHALTRLYETRRSYVSVNTASTTDDDCKKTASNKEQEDARTRFESLTPTQREILEWAFCSGLSAEGIAAGTGTSVGAVKTHVRIGLNRLGKMPEFPKINPESAMRQEAPTNRSEGTVQ